MVKVYVLKFTKVWYKKAKYSRWVLNVHSEVTVFAYTMAVRGTLLEIPRTVCFFQDYCFSS